MRVYEDGSGAIQHNIDKNKNEAFRNIDKMR